MRHLARFLWPVVLPAVAIGGRAQSGAPSKDEEEAGKELARIEELFLEGQYRKVRNAYERLAARFPDTGAGQRAARRAKPSALLGSRDLMRNGPSANRVDVVVMGDGYVLGKLNSFDDLAKSVPTMFAQNEVFGEYFAYLDFLSAGVVSEEEGLDGYGREAKTALGAHILPGNSVDHVWADVALVRGVLEDAGENDGYAIVFVPLGTVGSGGNDVAVVAGRDPREMLHEWGHAFAELQDEYATDTSDRGGVVSWINVSDSEDEERVPWRHWLWAKVPGIGVYEGADGRVRGAFKPTASGCLMEEGEAYCSVCREAIVLRIYQHADPIEDARVPSAPGVEAEGELAGEGPHRFEVRTLRPREHALEVEWWVLPEREAPPPSGDPGQRPRALRGPLSPIAAKPARHSRAKDGTHSFELDPEELEPGRYRVIARAKDTTEFRGERFPWVLKDERGLLESERAWWVVVP